LTNKAEEVSDGLADFGDSAENENNLIFFDVFTMKIYFEFFLIIEVGRVIL